MHYRNGREAKVGDPVVGTVFNNGGKVVAGTLISLTPGTDACSAMVSYAIAVLAVDLEKQEPKGSYLKVDGQAIYNAVPVKVAGAEQHGSAGPLAVTFSTTDYTECKYLLHAEDAHLMSQPLEGVSEP